MQLAKLSISKLNALKTAIDKQVAHRLKIDKIKVRKEIEKLAKARGYALDELIGKTPKAVKKKTRKPAKVKYQHPSKKELAWTGRGRQPAWVKEWVKGGQSIDKLLLNK